MIGQRHCYKGCADKGRAFTVVMNKIDYHDKMDALETTNRPTKNSNLTRLRHYNVNLTAKYLRSRRLTLLTLNATTD